MQHIILLLLSRVNRLFTPSRSSDRHIDARSMRQRRKLVRVAARSVRVERFIMHMHQIAVRAPVWHERWSSYREQDDVEEPGEAEEDVGERCCCERHGLGVEFAEADDADGEDGRYVYCGVAVGHAY